MYKLIITLRDGTVIERIYVTDSMAAAHLIAHNRHEGRYESIRVRDLVIQISDAAKVAYRKLEENRIHG